MMNNKDHTEDIIRKLVHDSELQSPSESFTDNIMNKIQTENRPETVTPDQNFNIWQILLIIVPGILLIAGAFYYYWQDFATMFNSVHITNSFVPYIQELFGKGADVLSKQEFSPILIIVLISVGILMIIERVAHLGKRTKSYLFTI